jgi:hypothetical protein
MSIGFGGKSEKAFIPQHEVSAVEVILDRPFKEVVSRIVERRRAACETGGKCGLKATVNTEADGPGGQSGVEALVSCSRLICRCAELFSETATEIRGIGDVYGDIGDDGPFESFEAEEALRARFC